jgi:hypothetical protein
MGFENGWDSLRLTCMHGVLEGLDSHDCPECAVIARETGQDTATGKTYLYQKDPRSKEQEADRAPKS